jgi:hypothetical protein
MADFGVAITPPSIQRVQVDVGQQRANDPALGNASPSLLSPPLYDDSGTQPLIDQLQHPAITDPPPDQLPKKLVVHLVKEALDVSIQNPPTTDQRLLDRQHCLPRTPLGPIPIRARQKARFKERLDDDFARLLDHSISNGRDPQQTCPTIWLRNPHLQHRAGAVTLRLQVVRECSEESLDALAFDLFDPHAIDSGNTPVYPHFFPGPPQHIGPDDAVVQSVEPSVPTPLGRKIQSALEFS